MHQKRGNSPPKRVQVARTLVEPQPKLSGFLDAFGRHLVTRLGNQAVVATLGTLHITLLESGGTTHAFRRKKYSPQDVHTFSVALEQFLAEIEGTRNGLLVEVNQKNPFKWYGWRSNKLALNLLPSTALGQERRHIEAFVQERLGNLATLDALDEHVAIASFNVHALKPEEQRNPRLLLPPGLAAPNQIAVNGLVVFINGIGDEPR